MRTTPTTTLQTPLLVKTPFRVKSNADLKSSQYNAIFMSVIELKVIPLKLFYYQTFFETWHTWVINIHDMNIKKMQ